MSSVTALSFSPSQLASGSLDGTIVVWNPISSTCLQTIKSPHNVVSSVGLAGLRLASAGRNGRVRVWDSRSGACLSRSRNYLRGPVAISHDLALYALKSKEGTTIDLRSVSDDTCLRTFKGHTEYIRLIAFSHDSAWLISASQDDTVKIWDVFNGRCLRTFQGHSGWSTSFDISHDLKRLASVEIDGIARIWDTNSDRASVEIPEKYGETVIAMAFSYDSLLLAMCSWDTTEIWSCESGACVQVLRGSGDAAGAVAFSYDSQRLAVCDAEGCVQIWDVSDINNASCLRTFQIGNQDLGPTALLLGPSQLVVGTYIGEVQVFDLRTETCVKVLNVGVGGIQCVALSNGLNQLACAWRDGQSSDITIWNGQRRMPKKCPHRKEDRPPVFRFYRVNLTYRTRPRWHGTTAFAHGSW